MNELLQIEGLAVDLRAGPAMLRVVEDVSLHVRPGECVALVGESGCGKSITALSVMRLLPSSARIGAGRVLFRGRDLARLSPSAMRAVRGGEIGMVFQDPMTFLNPLIRVGEQIAEAVRLHTGATRRAAGDAALEVLKRVRIPAPDSVFNRYPHQLSGGMRQRVLIAIAVACRPALLICDEPTTALDVTVQAAVMDLLHMLRMELGSATLLISHDLGLVAEYCDRAYVMYAGRIVEQAGIEALFATPQHPYTHALLNSTLRSDRRQDMFLTIEGQPPNPAAPPAGCRFHPRCPNMFARCAAVEPPLYALGAGRASRCLLQEPRA